MNKKISLFDLQIEKKIPLFPAPQKREGQRQRKPSTIKWYVVRFSERGKAVAIPEGRLKEVKCMKVTDKAFTKEGADTFIKGMVR